MKTSKIKEAPEFQLSPSHCLLDITVFKNTGNSDATEYLVFSSLKESIELSKTLLDDIARQAIVSFVEDFVVNHALDGVPVMSEAYCNGLSAALGLERLVIRFKTHEKLPTPATAVENKEEAAALAEQLGEAIVASVNAEAALRRADERMMECFKGVSKANFLAWLFRKEIDPVVASEMRSLWQRANTELQQE